MAERHAPPRDLPLFRWGAELRRARDARRRLRARLTIGAAGVSLLALSIVDPPLPRLLLNRSASAPKGLYQVLPRAELRVGDMVVARTPRSVRWLAAERRYLPSNVPLVKRIAAARGDLVCGIGHAVFINGRLAARRLAEDPAGRILPWWTGCVRLLDSEYLLLMSDVESSFDGRYFGPVTERDIIGKAVPLWVR